MKWLVDRMITYDNRPAIIFKDEIFTYTHLFQKIKTYRASYGDLTHQLILLQGIYSVDILALFLALALNDNYVCPLIQADALLLMDKKDLLNPDVTITVEETGNITMVYHQTGIQNVLLNTLKAAGHPGVILFSSGTSGLPKVVVHDLVQLTKPYQHIASKSYNILPLLGFDHIGGLDILFRQLAAGATQTIPITKTPQHICSLIEKHCVSVFSASPTFYNLLLLSGEYKKFNLRSLKILAYGSEPMPQWLLTRLGDAFPQADLQQKYGLSETNAIRIKGEANGLFFRIDDPGVEYRIIDHVLWIKSDQLYIGSLNRPDDNFQQEGWFCTGDLVEQNENGLLRIMGRETEVINVGGKKVLPYEVESVLMQIPFISDCKVKGVPNIITGQTLVAEIVTFGNLSTDDLKLEIRKRLSRLLAPFKIPSKFIFVEKIEVSDRFKKFR